MRILQCQFLHLVGAAAVVASASQKAAAQAFPAQPITTVVPFRAAGPADPIGRISGERIRVSSLGQSAIVENLGGTAARIAVGVVWAAPDGYDVVLGNPGAKCVNRTVADRRSGDFEAVALLGLRARKGTPNGIIERLNAAVVETLADARCGPDLVISTSRSHRPSSKRRRPLRAGNEERSRSGGRLSTPPDIGAE